MRLHTTTAFVCAMIALALFAPEAAAATDEAFKLRNGHSGMYLSLTGAVRQNGGRMVQWRDVGQPDAVWHFEAQDGGAFRIRNGLSGRYLTADADGDVVQWADEGQSGLSWRLETAEPADCYRIRNGDKGGYLSVAKDSRKEGAGVVQQPDAAAAGAVWCRETLEDLDAAAELVTKLMNDYSRLYLAVQEDDNAIQTGDADRADAVWVMLRQEPGIFKIRNADTGKYLAVAGDSTAAGGNVVQSDDTAQPSLLWERDKAETGNCYKFRNHNSGMYLTVDDASHAEGANVIQWGDVGHRLDIEWCRVR